MTEGPRPIRPDEDEVRVSGAFQLSRFIRRRRDGALVLPHEEEEGERNPDGVEKHEDRGERREGSVRALVAGDRQVLLEERHGRADGAAAEHLEDLQREGCQVGPKDASWPMHSCENTAKKS